MRNDVRLKFKILNVFDFDDTLVRTVGPCAFKAAKQLRPDLDLAEEDIVNNKFNWWDHPISLDTDLFDFPLISQVFEKYKESLSNDKMCNAIITHRATHMVEPIKKLLEKLGITHIHEFMANRLIIPKSVYLKLILKDYPNIDTINIYEDSIKHINDYYDYLKERRTSFRYINFYMVNTMGTFDVNPPINYNTYVENKLIF